MSRGVFGLVAATVLLAAAPAEAHPVVVDGITSDWSSRNTPFANMGIVARDQQQRGEYIFVDAAGDERTDLTGTSAVEQDLRRFQVTADADSISFLVRTTGADSTATSQVQITIDLDRVAGSGQAALAGGADTTVTDDARWEYLIQTSFADGVPDARVLDTTFAQVATVAAARGATGNVEIDVPWAALGLAGPPATPVRVTATTYRADADEQTIDIGGADVSDAIDAIGDCGDPRQSGFPNALPCDLADGDLDFFADVYVEADGDAMSPLLITHAVPDAGAAEPGAEWIAIRNVAGVAVSTGGAKLGDEEQPDVALASEYMALLPDLTVGPGETITIAGSGLAYQTRYGELPTIEVVTGTDAADMGGAYTPWAATAVVPNLANVGDQVVLLDGSNTILDVFNYGSSGNFPGIDALIIPMVDDRVLVRTPPTVDTDDNDTDFTSGGIACGDASVCTGGAGCNACTVNVCVAAMAGESCADGTVCNGGEVCDGAGTCLAGTPLVCEDTSVCTDDACDPAAGCTFTPRDAGASCADADACDGAEVCDGAGACQSVPPLDCDDHNPCTADACDAAAGCVHTPVGAGISCSDGDACNGAEACDGAGACAAGAPLVCADGNVCTDDACDPAAGCVFAPTTAGSPCLDGDACNGAETCDGAGACAAGAPLACDDGSVCTNDACEAATGCVYTFASPSTLCRAAAGDCDVTETCTGDAAACPADVWLGSSTTCRAAAGQCDAAEVCSGAAPVCPPDEARPDGAPCTDGDLCTAGDACAAGACVPAGPALRIDPARVDFPITTMGMIETRTLDVTNAAAASIEVVDIRTTDPATFEVPSPAPLTLEPADAMPLDIHFIPTAISPFVDVLTIDTRECGPYEVELTGTGELAGFEIAPAAVDFGDVAVLPPFPEQVFTITNTGAGAFTIDFIMIDNLADYGMKPVELPAVVPPGGSIELAVTAHPMALGDRPGMLYVVFSGADAVVPMRMFGVPELAAKTSGTPPGVADEREVEELAADVEGDDAAAGCRASSGGASALVGLALITLLGRRRRRP